MHLLFYLGRSGPGFESRSGHLMDLFSIVSSSNPRCLLTGKVFNPVMFYLFVSTC